MCLEECCERTRIEAGPESSQGEGEEEEQEEEQEVITGRYLSSLDGQRGIYVRNARNTYCLNMCVDRRNVFNPIVSVCEGKSQKSPESVNGESPAETGHTTRHETQGVAGQTERGKQD